MRKLICGKQLQTPFCHVLYVKYRFLRKTHFTDIKQICFNPKRIMIKQAFVPKYMYTVAMCELYKPFK